MGAYVVNKRCMVTGRTMLHEAAGCGQTEVVKLLCREFKADVNVPTVMGKSVAIHMAAAGGYVDTLMLMLPCTRAIVLFHLQYIPFPRIPSRCEITDGTPTYPTPSYFMNSSPSFRQIVAMLMTHGADVNARDAQRNTPLHYCNKLNVMKTLLRFGGDGASKNKHGKTPAQYYELMTDVHHIDPLVLAELTRRYNEYMKQLLRFSRRNALTFYCMALARD